MTKEILEEFRENLDYMCEKFKFIREMRDD
jgi:hypothetical protein